MTARIRSVSFKPTTTRFDMHIIMRANPDVSVWVVPWRENPYAGKTTYFSRGKRAVERIGYD